MRHRLSLVSWLTVLVAVIEVSTNTPRRWGHPLSNQVINGGVPEMAEVTAGD
jgi:hypothetical protein